MWVGGIKGSLPLQSLCWEPWLVPNPRVVQRSVHVQLGWEGTKEKFWPVFTWQVTAIRSKQAHRAGESRAVTAQVVPSLTSLPTPAPPVRLVQVRLHLGENGAEIPASHSVISSERGRGCRVRDVCSFHANLHHGGHISQCHPGQHSQCCPVALGCCPTTITLSTTASSAL